MQSNIEFLEEYKKLDKLCKDMYSGYEGVSSYITEMEETEYNRPLTISTWDTTYKQLKHLRWKRNQLAHELDISSEFCTQDDIDWVKQFHSDILTGNDPLAVANKIRQESSTRQTTVHYSPPVQNNVEHNTEVNKPPESLWNRIKSAFKRLFS